MRTTVVLDEELVQAAQEYTGIKEKSALVREALKSLIQREAARRLARRLHRDHGGARRSRHLGRPLSGSSARRKRRE